VDVQFVLETTNISVQDMATTLATHATLLSEASSTLAAAESSLSQGIDVAVQTGECLAHQHLSSLSFLMAISCACSRAHIFL
jgi:hypothetical protein